MTNFAPNVFAALTAVRPMGPQPLTRTVLPSTSAASTPCTPAPIGSNMQAASSGISSSSRKVQSERIAAYSAKAPSCVMPNSLMFPQMWGMPLRQNQHSLHWMCDSQDTRSPIFRSVTFLPTATTVPTVSCPRMTGAWMRFCDQASHSRICISVPQIALRWIFSRISSSFGSGIGRSVR